MHGKTCMARPRIQGYSIKGSLLLHFKSHLDPKSLWSLIK